MKIAIQGHLFRGKEVIEILASLGGKSIFAGLGFDEKYYYYINSNGMIIESLITIKTKDEFKLYTLEEFEKEFPFKIGDKVTIIGIPNYPKVITKMTWMDNEIFYTFGDNTWYNTGALRKLEMKEERNITLTLDKAKEWYKEGGELKEIALQAFTEEELTKIDLPKTWEEFLKVFPYSDAAKKAVKIMTDLPLRFSYQYEALIKLNYLRDYYAESYKEKHITDYYIYRNSTGFYNTGIDMIHHTLSFPSKHLADEFLKNFKDLINKASYLIA